MAILSAVPPVNRRFEMAAQRHSFQDPCMHDLNDCLRVVDVITSQGRQRWTPSGFIERQEGLWESVLLIG